LQVLAKKSAMNLQRLSLRFGPALLTLLLALAGVRASGLQVTGSPQPEVWNPEALEPETPAADCAAFLPLSEQAAGLTGMLALVEAEERPAQAAVAAQQVRALSVQAAGLEGGAEWAAVLSDLADALAGYARGDPAALGEVREASARNAQLRAGCDIDHGQQTTDDRRRTTDNSGPWSVVRGLSSTVNSRR